ncbi:glycosyltransferase family 2 protein [Puniceicoccaceae bacterium K14]|nr:glycosyltransferase family 2 protein [Puniceicoccaceae bacterium K14]
MNHDASKGPRISIIIPTYKAESHIERCIRSIFSQSFTDFEIIAINDASPDNSLKKLAKLRNEDSRLIIIDKKENGGVHQARADGVDAAKGAFITFADSDDWYEKDFLNVLNDSIIEHDAEIALCGVRLVNAEGKKTDNKVSLPNACFKGSEGYEKFCNLELGTGSLWNKLYSSHLIKEFGSKHWGWRADAAEDTLVNIGCFQRAKTISTCSRTLYNYVIHSENATQTAGNALSYARILRAYASAIDIYREFDELELKSIDTIYRKQLNMPCYHVTSSECLTDHKTILEESIQILAELRPSALYEFANFGISCPESSILHESSKNQMLWTLRRALRKVKKIFRPIK